MQPQAPVDDSTPYDRPTWDQLHERWTLGGYCRKDAQEDSKTRKASMGAAEARRKPAEGDDADTSETITGKRERALVEGVMDSDIPSHPSGKKCRLGDLHMASVAEKEVVAKRAQWWHSKMKGGKDTRPRKDPRAPPVMDREGAALSAWAVEELERVPGQKLPGHGERAYAEDLAGEAKAKGNRPKAWKLNGDLAWKPDVEIGKPKAKAQRRPGVEIDGDLPGQAKGMERARGNSSKSPQL